MKMFVNTGTLPYAVTVILPTPTLPPPLPPRRQNYIILFLLYIEYNADLGLCYRHYLQLLE